MTRQQMANRRYIRRKIEQLVELFYGTVTILGILAIYWMLSMLPEHVYKFTH